MSDIQLPDDQNDEYYDYEDTKNIGCGIIAIVALVVGMVVWLTFWK